MSVKVMFSYPETMSREIRRQGMKWWAQGGEFDSFESAIEEARRIAEEKNFPIQIAFMGNKLVVYPKSIGY